jgi:hypothetical protein
MRGVSEVIGGALFIFNPTGKFQSRHFTIQKQELNIKAIIIAFNFNQKGELP